MAIGIFVLESSIVDFAGAVVAVGPDATGLTFDSPHLHPATDREGSQKREAAKRTFFVGGPEAPDLGRAIGEIRKILRSIAVPMIGTNPIVNSDGITIRQFMVYRSSKVDLLIPKLFSGLAFGSPDTLTCGHRAHFVLRSLEYSFCPVDGTPLDAAGGRRGIFETFLKEKFRISEVRVEEPQARKVCGKCRGGPYFPNVFSRCPRCGSALSVPDRKPKGGA